MKKIVLLLAFTFLGSTVLTAQEVAAKKVVKKTVKKEVSKVAVKGTKAAAVAKVGTPAVEGAGMVFDNETIDYGTIAHNANGDREFTFTNNGNKPLTITNAQGSCGCTVPTTPKEPIAPGAKGVIGVHYATDRVGAFTKTVTVTSNAAGAESKLLTIKGTVLADEPAVSPLTPKS